VRTVAAGAAAAIVFAMAFSPIIGTAPTATAASQGSPARLAIIVPITVPERQTGFIDAALLENYTSQFGLLSRALDQVVDRPVTLAIDPSIIASIRVLGDSAPESALLWLDRLAAAQNETFPLLWADSDVTAPLQAGSPEVLAPESFDFAINPARFAASGSDPVASPDPTTTPEPATGPPPLPTTESLTAWNYTIPSIVWPALNSVTSADLKPLAADFGSVLLSSGNVSGLAPGSAHATIGSSDVVVTDEDLSALFSSTVDSQTGADWQAAVTALVAAAAAPEAVGGSGDTIITLDRTVSTADADLGATVDALANHESITAVGLAELLNAPASTATLVDRPESEARIASVRAMLVEESGDRSFATIAADPSLITAERRLDLLATLGNGWGDNELNWKSAVDGYTQASTELRAKVAIVDSSAITLLADRASLPVTVSNELGQPITVLITVRPLTPLLKVEDSFVAITVEPESQRKGQIPVQSLSNGVVELAISLHGVDGVAIGDTAFVETTVQAGWETPFTVAFAVLVVLVFIAGIVRTVIRRRRARAAGA
jgi:hypothetical protein